MNGKPGIEAKKKFPGEGFKRLWPPKRRSVDCED